MWRQPAAILNGLACQLWLAMARSTPQRRPKRRIWRRSLFCVRDVTYYDVTCNRMLAVMPASAPVAAMAARGSRQAAARGVANTAVPW